MTDVVSPEVRSRMMSGIKNKNTKPELIIRKGLYSRGYRYRLHDKKLPGKPDLVLKKYNSVIFINGCFWHGHENCHLFRIPKSRTKFWEDKITSNKLRDENNVDTLKSDGWKVLILWECTIKGKHKLNYDQLMGKVCHFLKNKHKNNFLEIRS